MKISVYVPRDLEGLLEAEAAEAGESPSMFLQGLLRERLERKPRKVSYAFLALAGSWAEDRSAAEIMQEIEDSRVSTERPPLQ